MKMSEAFPSKYLKAEQLQGKSVTLTIAGCTMDEIGQEKERRPVVHFKGTELGLVLNKTNGGMIAAYYGDETDDWIGQKLEIYPDKTQFQGKIVDCIRVRKPIEQSSPAPSPSAAAQGLSDLKAAAGNEPPPFDDDIPF